jgi:hypothetical protein
MTTPPQDSSPAVPPYEGRQTSAHAEQETEKDGARTAGATAPVSDDEAKAPDPADTDAGATASPADEQPAEQTPDGDSPEATTGPAHEPGTGRGEEHASGD